MAVSIASGLETALPTHPPLLKLLADGEVHSGESLAAELHQTRAAVWKGVERLRAVGIEVQALARRGYRLARPVELLDAGRIRAELAEDRKRAPAQPGVVVRSRIDQHPPAQQRAAASEHGGCLHG